MRPYIGDAMLLITAIVWGSGFVVTAIALEHLTAFQVMAGRFVLASIILSILFGYKFKYFSKSILTKGVILGAILYTGFALQTVGLEYTTPSQNAFLTAVNVVIVPLIAFAIYKRKISGQEITGAFLALVGVGFMSLEGSLAMNIGDLLSLACAVAFAFDIFYTNMFVKKEDAISLTMVQFMTAAFLSVMTVLIQGDVPVAVEREAVYAIVYLAVFSTTIAYVCQNVAFRYTTATKGSIILSTESLFGMLLSVIFLKEVLTWQMVVGAALIMAAILLAELKPEVFKKKDERERVS